MLNIGDLAITQGEFMNLGGEPMTTTLQKQDKSLIHFTFFSYTHRQV